MHSASVHVDESPMPAWGGDACMGQLRALSETKTAL